MQELFSLLIRDALQKVRLCTNEGYQSGLIRLCQLERSNCRRKIAKTRPREIPGTINRSISPKVIGIEIQTVLGQGVTDHVLRVNRLPEASKVNADLLEQRQSCIAHGSLLQVKASTHAQ